jgi:hypothetical protein
MHVKAVQTMRVRVTSQLGTSLVDACSFKLAGWIDSMPPGSSG